MLLVVLNDWVIETKDTPCWSNNSTSLAKSASDRVNPVDLVDHDDIHLAGPDFGQEVLQGGTVEGSPRQTTVVIMGWQQAPALMGLTLYVRFAGLSLGIERVELEVEIMLG